jgi:hypothetical protein
MARQFLDIGKDEIATPALWGGLAMTKVDYLFNHVSSSTYQLRKRMARQSPVIGKDEIATPALWGGLAMTKSDSLFTKMYSSIFFQACHSIYG